jgi:GT2 family glycosyltransferase
VSVIVPTVHRPGPLARCLGALAHQDVDPTGFEVLVIDDAPDGGARLNDGVPYTARLLRAGGGGAAAARNLGAVEARGRILLFLDDDLVPAPDLVRRHLDAHEPGGDPAVVIGRSAPRPPRGSLSELGAGLWWEDLFAGMRRAPVLTFPQTLSGNASVPREAFLALGGFPEDMARRRREDWAWGLALQEARVPVRYVHEAVAHHEFRLDPVGRWRAARQEARGDALVLRRWPNALPGLPAMGRVGAPSQRFRGRLWRAALTSEVGGRRAAAVLARLERLRLRRAWMRLNGAGERVAYDAGLRDEGLVLPDVAPEGLDVCDVDLRAEDPIPAPEHGMPVLRVHAGPGEELRLPSPEGDWGAPLADHLARAVPWSLWRLALARPPAAAEVPADPAQVTLVTRPSFARFPVGMRRAPLVVDEDWAAVDRALATATTPYVIVAFDALVTSQEWLDAALLPFTGDRVAVVTGEVHEGEDPEPPTVLHDLDRRALPYQRFPLRMAYVALRVSAVADVGGLDLSQARHGPHAPLLDLLERLLEAGHVVAERNAPELGRAWAANGQRAMHVAPLERTGARMALARARSQGGAAGAVLGVRTLFRAAGSIRRSAGGRAAWLMGALRR